jgi:hypothetical protein
MTVSKDHKSIPFSHGLSFLSQLIFFSGEEKCAKDTRKNKGASAHTGAGVESRGRGSGGSGTSGGSGIGVDGLDGDERILERDGVSGLEARVERGSDEGQVSSQDFPRVGGKDSSGHGQNGSSSSETHCYCWLLLKRGCWVRKGGGGGRRRLVQVECGLTVQGTDGDGQESKEERKRERETKMWKERNTLTEKTIGCWLSHQPYFFDTIAPWKKTCHRISHLSAEITLWPRAIEEWRQETKRIKKER